MDRIKLIFLSLLVLPVSVFAMIPFGAYLQADAGAAFSKIGHSQLVEVLDQPSQVLDSFVANRSEQTALDGGVHLGVYVRPIPRITFEAGVGGYGTTDYHAKGFLYQYQYLKNYSYKYNVRALRLMAEGTLSFLINPSVGYGAVGEPFITPYPYFAPYVSFGIGPAWVTASNFTYNSFVAENPPSEWKDHTKSTTATQWGAGIKIQVNPHVGFVAGYRYVDIGKGTLGSQKPRAEGNLYKNTLDTGKIILNEVFCGVDYWF